MSLMNLSLKHGRTLDEARAKLESTVTEMRSQFAAMIQKVEWSPDRNRVKIVGTGFEGELRVDAVEVHATVDVPMLGGFLANSLKANLEQILQHNFPRLPRG
jgi:hypothetical protein